VAILAVAVGVARGLLVPPALVVPVVLAVLAGGVLAPRAGSLVRVILGLVIPVVGAAAVRRRAAALAAGPAAGLAVVVVLRGERREDGRERRVSARWSGRRKLEEDENS